MKHWRLSSGSIQRMPALIDEPRGAGHVLTCTWNPLHRYQNHHGFAFLFDALLFHDDLSGTPS